MCRPVRKTLAFTRKSFIIATPPKLYVTVSWKAPSRSSAMNPTIVAALVGLLGIPLGVVLKEMLPRWLSRGPKGHSLLGDWDSSWGPYPEGPLNQHEILTIESQHGFQIFGSSHRPEEPDKKWKVEGRYDGTFLQMYYFPSSDSKDTDFLDYGCYFLKRKAAGNLEGYSTGFGAYDENLSKEAITADYHVIHRHSVSAQR
jgi:hypothetical protein